MAGIHLSNIGVWRGRIKALRALPIFNVSRQLRMPHAMLRRSREFKNSAACKPLRKEGGDAGDRNAAVRTKCSLLFRAKRLACWAGRDWNKGREGLPHPAILGTDSMILRWNRSAGMFDASPRLTRGGYRLHRPPFDWHRGKAAGFRGAPDLAPCCLHGPATAETLRICRRLGEAERLPFPDRLISVEEGARPVILLPTSASTSAPL
jgi:hypothetical protein